MNRMHFKHNKLNARAIEMNITLQWMLKKRQRQR